MARTFDPTVYDAMQAGEPYSSYKKTTLGKVHVVVLNPFNQEPTGLILEGEGADAIVNIWTVMEDVFFKRQNRRHFEKGILIPYKKPVETKEIPTIEQASDEELTEAVNQPFLTLRSILNKTDSEALVYRLLSIARKEEKSVKVIEAIEKRLGEIQQMGLPKPQEE